MIPNGMVCYTGSTGEDSPKKEKEKEMKEKITRSMRNELLWLESIEFREGWSAPAFWSATQTSVMRSLEKRGLVEIKASKQGTMSLTTGTFSWKRQARITPEGIDYLNEVSA